MPNWGRGASARLEARPWPALPRQGFGRCGMVALIAERRQAGRMPGVGVRSALRLPRRAARWRPAARQKTIASGTQAACARLVFDGRANDGSWPWSHGMSLVWSTNAGFSRVVSKNRFVGVGGIASSLLRLRNYG